MAKKIVIVGAVALGPKVACRVRRLDPQAEITVVDRDNLISYGGCGIPYYVSGDINDIEDLYSTSAHIKRDVGFFHDCKGVQMLTRVEAIAIDRPAHRLQVRYLDEDREEWLEYDKLVLATGASAVRPPIPGTELPGVFTVTNLHDAEQVKTMMAQGKVGRAVVIGGGAIGLEMAEALTDLWGIETTLVEMEDQVLPTLLGKCIARLTETHLCEKGVRLMLAERVKEICKDPHGGNLLVQTSEEALPADLVVLSAGVRANGRLAREAGLAVGRSGGILVDNRLRTSDPDIYAGGDCIEVRNLMSGENHMMALGSLANRQGRIIGSNICGGSSRFLGGVGTFCVKVFDLGVCKAGLTFRQAKLAGYDPVYSTVVQPDHAHFFPDAEFIYLTLLADRKSRKVLGVEAAGRHGDAVKARVDAVAALLAKDCTVDEICTLEAGYAPPFASAMDVINNGANALDNILAGMNRPVDVVDFLAEFSGNGRRVLDIRGEKEATPFLEKFGKSWLNIPQTQLRARHLEIPRDEEFYLICDTGARSYEAQVFLTSCGVEKTMQIQGGYAMISALAPDFLSGR